MNQLKFYSFFVFVALLAMGCAPKGLDVKYNPSGITALKNNLVAVQVIDDRATKNLIGYEAQSKDLFKGVVGDNFSLTIDLPNGSSITRTNINAPNAVREAVAQRLKLMGLDVTFNPSEGATVVKVHIKQLQIDLKDNYFVADVSLSASYNINPRKELTTNSNASSSKLKLIGDSSGAAALSEALSSAINELNFQDLNAL